MGGLKACFQSKRLRSETNIFGITIEFSVEQQSKVNQNNALPCTINPADDEYHNYKFQKMLNYQMRGWLCERAMIDTSTPSASIPNRGKYKNCSLN